jgi:hypothetical protein
MGDQFLLRDGVVIRLAAETGTIETAAGSLTEFLSHTPTDPVETLQMHPLLQFEAEGNHLQPGQLLSAVPPFCTAESASGVSLRAISTLDRRGFVASFARQITDVPDGGTIKFEISASEKCRRTTR